MPGTIIEGYHVVGQLYDCDINQLHMILTTVAQYDITIGSWAIIYLNQAHMIVIFFWHLARRCFKVLLPRIGKPKTHPLIGAYWGIVWNLSGKALGISMGNWGCLKMGETETLGKSDGSSSYVMMFLQCGRSVVGLYMIIP